ncbi:multi drug resistance-associated protein MRP [Chlamydoabsidia padenii]|nr:multi drug resistance-associated protein MRP [Chlamydoabsidia padenii]
MTQNWLYFMKMVVLIMIVLTSVATLVVLEDKKTWPSAQWIAILLNTTFAFLISIFLHHMEYTRNKVQSSLLLFYWLLVLIGDGIKLRTLLIIGNSQDADILYGVNYLLIILIFVLENIKRPMCQSISLDYDDSKLNPEESSSIFNRLLFLWMSPMIQKGYKKPLTMEDLWNLQHEDQSRSLSEQFEKDWNRELKRKSPSLARAVAKTCGGKYALAGLLKLTKDLLQYTQPVLLKQLILWVGSYLTDHPQPADYGVLIAVGMLLSSALQTICLHQYFHICFKTGMRVRSVLVTAIYRKTLILSNEGRQGSTVGEIVNHMAVDTTRIMDLFPNLHHVWSAPLQVCLAIGLLHNLLGPSIWVGVLILVLSVPINVTIARIMRKYQKTQMANKDMRIKLMNEILSAIKMIKLYAWEKPFMDKIGHIRNDLELVTLKQIGKMSALNSFTWSSVPFLVTVTSFGVYITTNQSLTSDIVFVAISLFGMLQFPLTMAPDVISGIIEASVSLRRIQSFLILEEMDPQTVIHEDYRQIPDWTLETPLVEIHHGSFRWASQSTEIQSTTATTPTSSAEAVSSTPPTVLSDINLQVKKGELLAIVGRVGTGKSTLISALLGEAVKTQGAVILRGSVAYAPQKPWLLNATVQDNIIFGHRFDQVFYDKVLDACALRPDLFILTDGDQTEIGERGINLSGGQKARISLARALYSRADIYLLDDPLSAVDAHVGKHLFDNVIGPHGLLKNKARILVTHAITHLPLVNRIMMLLNNGHTLYDTYDNLMTNKTELYTLLMEYSSQSTADNVQLDVNEESDKLSTSSSSKSSTIHSVRRASYNQIDWKITATETDSGHSRKDQGKAGNLVTTEEANKGSVSFDVYKSYIEACSWWGFGGAIIIQAISQGLQVSGNLWLKLWSANNDKNGMENVWMYLIIYALIGWSSTFFAVSQTLVLRVYCAIRSAKLLHFNMLDAVIHSPMSFFDTTPVGRILNRFAKDQHTVDELVPRVFGIFFRVFPQVVATMLVIGFSTPMFLVFMVPLFTVYRVIQKRYLAASRELKRLDSIGRSPIYSHFQETIAGVSTIRAYEQQGRFIHQNEQTLDSNQQAYYASMASNRWMALRLELLGSLVIFAAAFLSVMGVVYQASSSSPPSPSLLQDTLRGRAFSFVANIMAKLTTVAVDPGLVGLSVSYALSVTGALTFTIRAYCEIETRIVSVERIKEYTELPGEKYEGEVSPPSRWPAHGNIIFEDFATRYRPSLPLSLHNITFAINSGERIGICGRTGGGKSSLTLGLFRILEAAEGSITIDGISIDKLGLNNLRSRLSILPQEPILFVGSIRDNLDPFGEQDDAALWIALEQAHLRQTIEGMEGKLDAIVLEDGENFSVGERQLICLARALLRSTSILVLDEATAAIDVETDSLIQTTIRQHFDHSTTILTIAHRINTILDSDKILVLDHGTIAEYDTPSALLADSNSMFYALCKEANVLPIGE